MLHNHCPACAEICHSHVHTVRPFKHYDAHMIESCFAPKIVHVYTALNYILTVLRETPACMNIFTRFIISKTWSLLTVHNTWTLVKQCETYCNMKWQKQKTIVQVDEYQTRTNSIFGMCMDWLCGTEQKVRANTNQSTSNVETKCQWGWATYSVQMSPHNAVGKMLLEELG